MAENKPFVINDRRKFTAEGEPRPDAVPRDTPDSIAAPDIAAPQSTDAAPDQARSAQANAASELFGSGSSGPAIVAQAPGHEAPPAGPDTSLEPEPDTFPPPPTPEETAQVNRAYEATVDRLDTAIRASNPGADRMPAMTFERLVQSLYMQALIQLGGAPEPGQPPQVDLIGARQTIDMLAILATKVLGNLSESEDRLLESALFELRMGFLEVTQALSRQAAARQPGASQFAPGAPGPSIVR